MKKVNLKDLYPDVYKNDHFVEVTEDVLETIRAAEGSEAAFFAKAGSFAMAFFRLLVTIDVLLVLAPSTAIR